MVPVEKSPGRLDGYRFFGKNWLPCFLEKFGNRSGVADNVAVVAQEAVDDEFFPRFAPKLDHPKNCLHF